MTGKIKKFTFGLAVVVAIIGLVVAFPITYGAAAISSAVVDVWVPNESGKMLVVPYVKDKKLLASSHELTTAVVSDADVRKIRGALSKTRVLYGFYSSGIVTVESSTTARAMFWRRNTALQISLAKQGTDWGVTSVAEMGAHHVLSTGRWDGILDWISGKMP
jgi:hypothetical protein